MRENFSDLSKPEIEILFPELAKRVIAELRQFTEGALPALSHTLAQRADAGLVVDGHGDLRLEHIAIEKTPHLKAQIFDCVEFSDDIRCGDVAADIAFLAMDLEKRQRPDLAVLLEKHYQEIFPQANLSEVLKAFKMYRAMVRAKIHALRCRQLRDAAAQEEIDKSAFFVALASRYRLKIPLPLLIVVCGLSASGKSLLAKDLNQYLFAPPLVADRIRKEILGPGDYQPGMPIAKGIYTNEASEKIYRIIFERAMTLIERGNPVILDATFMKRAHRHEAAALGARLNVPVALIECRLDDASTLERLEKRRRAGSSVSDAEREVWEWQKTQWEPVLDDEFKICITVSTAGPKHSASAEVLKKLQTSFSNALL